MGNTVVECCAQVTTARKSLSQQTTDSRSDYLCAENLRVYNLNKKSEISKSHSDLSMLCHGVGLPLQPIDSNRSIIHHGHGHGPHRSAITMSYTSDTDLSDYDEFSEESNTKNDYVLYNTSNAVKIHSHSRSRTKSSSPPPITANQINRCKLINLNTKKNKKRKQREYPPNSITALQTELSEAEIKLKQEKHEKIVLQKENEKLRKKYELLCKKMLKKQVSLSESTKKLIPDKLLLPVSPSYSHNSSSFSITPVPSTPVAINWSNSSMPSSSPSPSQISINLAAENLAMSSLNEQSSTGTIKSVSPSPPPPPPSSDVHETEIDNEYECGSCIEECVGIRRIILALQWYASHGNDHEKVYKKMNHNSYGKNLIADYNHIMECHLNGSNMETDEMKYQYQIICDEVRKHVKQCSSSPCHGYRRYLRSKTANVHQAKTAQQSELQIYIHVIDSIHACFMHLATN